MVDGVACGEVPSETGKYGLFQQRDDGFTSFGSPGRSQGNLFGFGATIPRPVADPKTPAWGDRCIIQVQALGYKKEMDT